MPVIVFEGPDHSGKTTFAKALQNQLLVSQALEVEVEYQRSPVKDHGWSETYDHYLFDLVNASRGGLVIQDRTPEISESVYGTLRGEPRGRGWAVDLYQWINQEILLVYCKGNTRYLEGLHQDALGNRLQDEDHRRINLLYDQTFFNIHRVMLWANSPSFEVHYYDRYTAGQWIHTFQAISLWLSRQWPEKASALSTALYFPHNSEFPMLPEASSGL